jgi:exonuclease SbcC
MHISRVELENIKSHVSSTFEFARGTTAITGENGAGKTTIIEAIAWTLFDLLDYKKDVFLRQGTAKGHVRVTFVSGLDERSYTVFRDTGTAYSVTDSRLGTRVADKRDEVYRFLWQHLGLEPGTDLKALFREAIGVPQGTFTAIFLQGSVQRKAAFDRLLKVEEYRQAADKLRETAKFVDTEVGDIRESIARAEGELSRTQEVEDEHAAQAKLAAELSATLESINRELGANQVLLKALDAREAELNSLLLEKNRTAAEKDRASLVLSQAVTALARSTDAVGRVSDARAGHEEHIAALATLRELERERGERDKLRAELGKIETAIATVAAEGKNVRESLASIQTAHREVESLRPKVTDQEAIEREISALHERLAAARLAGPRLAGLKTQLDDIRRKYRENKSQLKTAEEKVSIAAELTALETRTGELMRGLAGLQANLERDERFQNEIRNGLCPILSQKCLNLKPGETLESFVTSQFADLRSQISDLKSEKALVDQSLILAREASRAVAALDTLRLRQAELETEGQRLKLEVESAEADAAALQTIEEDVAGAELRLKHLDDPRGRVRQLDKEIAREPMLREQQSSVEANLERLTSEKKQIEESLDQYKELDQRWADLVRTRDSTTDAHRIFITNEAEAGALAARQQELTIARTQFENVTNAADAADAEYSRSAGDYDRPHHEAMRTKLVEMERRHADAQARHLAADRREQQLAAELKRFSELRASLSNEFREKERLEGVADVTKFIRDTLKEAAPRVARNYVYHVSLEANQMFREITGGAERTLRWAEDYSIMLEEGGFERPFPSLSGGEQMAAALSVRLALLKQLTNIRIAFFDEPTTNMDAERRENFAMQISRITHFDQLFVISHDETFDNFVDHVVSVG